MDTSGQLGFFDLTHRYDALTQKGDPLVQLAQHIPWVRFRKTLEKSLQRSTRSKGGRPPFDALLMFKVLVLQALYNLSDDQTEYQIRDRLSFMRFLGLDLHQRIPDAKTIWLFRETLAQAGVVEPLFAQFDTYLANQGLQARGGQLIDASLVPCPNSAIPGWKMRRCRPASAQQTGSPSRRNGGRRIPTPAGPKSMGSVTLGIKIMSMWINSTNSFGSIPSRMRRCMTVKSWKTCCSPRPPGGTYGRMPPIGRTRLKAHSRRGSCVPRFSTGAIATSR